MDNTNANKLIFIFILFVLLLVLNVYNSKSYYMDNNTNIINNTNMLTYIPKTYSRLQLKNMKVYEDNNKLQKSINNFITNIINKAKEGYTSYETDIRLYGMNNMKECITRCTNIRHQLENIFINSLLTNEITTSKRYKHINNDKLTPVPGTFKFYIYYCRIHIVWE